MHFRRINPAARICSVSGKQNSRFRMYSHRKYLRFLAVLYAHFVRYRWREQRTRL